mmetsp:Transcript_40707/g.121414  ORF Transcript_40707/g.121414 Transcript_40707/m.121414 type:complete len:261 (+) Transcript_40707:3034-3816(+)
MHAHAHSSDSTVVWRLGTLCSNVVVRPCLRLERRCMSSSSGPPITSAPWSRSMAAASDTTVGALNMSVPAICTPSRVRSMLFALPASMLVPPSCVKKSAVALTGVSRPSTSVHTCWMSVCSSPFGATYSPAAAALAADQSTAGKPRRLTFPLGSVGNSAIGTTICGTIWSGSAARSASITAAASTSSGVTNATSRPWPLASFSTAATAAATPGAAPTAASTSPSSIRKPRILTWQSLRPTYWMSPLAIQRTRSPLLYMRA